MIITSTNPYYDDFDESKKYQRILFKPSYAVQARELTQIQTIIQSQIERFGKHMFDEGSLVVGGQFDIDNNVPYVVLNPVRPGATNVNINLSELEGKMIQGGTTGVKAYVLKTGYFVLDPDTDEFVPTLFIRYTSGGQNGLYSEFIQGEVLTDVDNTTSAVIATKWGDLAFGKGSLFTIEEGTIFTHGFFANFLRQTIVTSAFSQNPTCRVGFFVDKTIVTSDDDDSLLDNAQGYPNYAAPGADRLKIDPVLSLIEIDNTAALPEFVELFTIREGVVQQLKQRTQYAIIGDEIAKRTFDESGDYVVRGMGVVIREHLDTSPDEINEGYLKLDRGGNANLLAIGIEPGLAYVKGYEVNNLVTNYTSTPKSIDKVDVISQVVTPRIGHYIKVNQALGTIALDKGTLIRFYDTPQQRLTNRTKTLDTAPSGNIIGTARVRSVVKDSGVLGTEAGTLLIYLFDLQLNQGKTFASAKSVYCQSPIFFGDIVLSRVNNADIAVIQDAKHNTALYSLGNHIHKVRRHDLDTDGYEVNLTYVRQHTKRNVVIDSSGVIGAISELGTNESFNYGVTSGSGLSVHEKNTILVTVNENAFVKLPGTVSGAENTKVLNGVSTKFLLLNPGDKIRVTKSDYVTPGYTEILTVESATSDTKLIVRQTLESKIDADCIIQKVYYKGDFIDLNTTGSGTVDNTGRLVTIGQEAKTMSINLYENFIDGSGNNTTVSADVSYLVDRNIAKETTKKLVSDVCIKINCSTYTGNLKEKIDLGFSDVFRLKEIRKAPAGNGGADPFTNGTEGELVTNLFVFDNGQRDDLYDHASILPSSSITLTKNDWLLIVADIFEPIVTEGQGYFSIDSYPVNDSQASATSIFTHEIPTYRSKTTGFTYDLRNCLDFRPVRSNISSASNHVGVSRAFVINGAPVTSSTFFESGSLKMPDPTENIETDYSYYLARRDVVAVDKNGVFSVVKGLSATNPVTPVVPETLMGIAKIYIPPYPSLSTAYARILSKESMACKLDMITFARHTMRDIGVLKERIANLEYYNAINMLEKKATDMLIPDEDGKDRFKNGFFVDGFVDHSLGATYNSDYKIVVDSTETVIRPLYTMDSLQYTTSEALDNNLVRLSNGIMLKFTETTLLEQLKATTYRNIEQSVFRFIGTLTLVPDTDSWIDTTTVDKNVEFDLTVDYPTSQLEGNWGAWKSVVTGYNLYDRRVGDTSGDPSKSPKFYGTFATYAEALAYANRHDSDGRFFIETITTEEREKTDLIPKDVTDTQNLGSFVTDVSLATYIRPGVIVLHAVGLKPQTEFHVYFDGEDMDAYVSPITTGGPSIGIMSDTDYYKAVLAGPPPYKVVPVQREGTKLYSDKYGEILALLRLPAEGKRFRVGSRSVKITDSFTNAVDATSYCENYFVGQGLIVKKQNTILSIKHTTFIPEVEKDTRTTRKVQVYGPSCMAYSFLVKAPEGEDGVFMTSVDVWIKSVDTVNKLGMWFEIREMNSAGGITRTQVPFSEVHMKYNDSRIKLYDPEVSSLSNAATQYTRVNFECPVFLMNDTQYAFVIHTEGLNPNTYFWVSRLGEKDITTGDQVTARQLTGNVFTTNNNLNWDIVPDLDLKVRFNRAKFTPGMSGILRLGNIGYEFLTVNSANKYFSIVGEELEQSQVLSLTVASGTVAVGDVIQTSTEQATVVKVVSNKYYTTGFNFAVNQAFTVSGKASGTISSVNDNLTAVGVLLKHDLRYNTLQLSQSNGIFVPGCKVKGVRSGSTAIINTIDNKPYSTINFNPNYLEFTNTACRFEIRGVFYVVDPNGEYVFNDFIDVIPNSDVNFNKTLMVASRTNEINKVNGQRTLQAKITLSTQSEWVSPIVDMTRTNSVIVTNWINDDITGEDEPAGGNLLNKYISKTVTLAEGQDAEDLLVALTAYVPPGTTEKYPIKVWMKIWNKEDTGSLFENKNWIEMIGQEGILYSSLSNNKDFRSFNFKIPSNMMLGDVGEVQYSGTGNIWKPGVAVELNDILYVIDDKFKSGDVRYRHYKVVRAGTTKDTAPIHLSGSDADVAGKAILRAQYESLGTEWEDNLDVVEGQILSVPNANNDGFRHYRVTTGGNIQSSDAPTDIFPDVTIPYGNGVKLEGYLPTNGNLYNGFKQFAVKIGLLGTNSAVVPRVGDLRVIALQM